MKLQRKIVEPADQPTARRATAAGELNRRYSGRSEQVMPAARRADRRGAGPAKGAVGVAVAAAVLVGALATGMVDGTNTTLVIMGFDPDRAQLITSLLLGALAAGAVMAAIGRFGEAVVLGAASATLLYGGTFIVETQGALAANGANGVFDLGGWLLTLLTLIVSGVVSAWAGAALALTARPFVLRAIEVTKVGLTRRRSAPGTLRYPVAVAVVLALLIATLPTFGDLVNYAPDSLMRGGLPPVAAVATDGPPDPTPDASASESASASDTASTDTASAGPTQDAGQQAKPWLAWLPTGAGRIGSTNLAAPWKGGTSNAVDVTIYTPPGYDSAGSRRYPVLYEVPTGYRLWGGATNVRAALDTLIDSGDIPAMIVVFVDSLGGPFPDTECANSYDRREWYDTFVTKTVVGWIDGRYRTIARPAARAVAGMSEGGYCSAMLALRHPDVFDAAISFSGYYQAGASGVNSAAPFGGSRTLLAEYSPTTVAGKLDATDRARLYFVVVAKPNQPEFGLQATSFEKTLAAGGYIYDSIDSSEPHGWPQVRDNFPPAVEAWSGRLAATGVV